MNNTNNNNVTAFISCSPRYSDNTEFGLTQIKRCINSLYTELGFNSVPIYVIFDGTKGRPSEFTQEHAANYELKKNTFKNDPDIVSNTNIKIIEFDDWLHQANSLRKVMTQYTKTPLIFSIQEDTVILNSKDIDTNLIYNLLLNDDTVEYIKFFIHKDLTILPGQERHGRSVPGDYRPETLPATPHKSTNLLHKCTEWSDRPHFATLEHYNNYVWTNISLASKCTMEQSIKFKQVRTSTDWGTWIYGIRYNMQHEQDLCILKDSKLDRSFNRCATHHD